MATTEDGFVTETYYSTKECSVLARALLKEAFPGVKFSVRTEHHTSVNVSWTDGPTTKAVDRVVGHLKAGHFDGMQDLYEYDGGNLLANEDGTFEKVRYGAHYVFTQRDVSDEWTAEVVELFDRTVGRDLGSPKTPEDPWGAKFWNQMVELAVERVYSDSDEEPKLYHMVETDKTDMRDVFHRYVGGRSRMPKPK